VIAPRVQPSDFVKISGIWDSNPLNSDILLGKQSLNMSDKGSSKFDEERKKSKKSLDAQLISIFENCDELLTSLDSTGEAKCDIPLPPSAKANANSTSQAKSSSLDGKPFGKKQNINEEIHGNTSEAKKRLTKIILILFASIGVVAGLATYQEAKMTNEFLAQAVSILSKGQARNNKQSRPYLLRVIGFANSALKLNPHSDQAYGLRARAQAGIGKPKQAIDDAAKALSLNTRNWDAFFARANALYDLGNKKAAIADYNQAIAINPQYADAYLHRGRAYEVTGDLGRACRDWRTAASLGKANAADWVRKQCN